MTTLYWGEIEDNTAKNYEQKIYRFQNEIFFNASVNVETINRLIKFVHEVIHDEKLSAYREQNDLEIILHIDSHGGVVKDAFKFIDMVRQLQKKKIKLRTIINGAACSSATLMAIVADKKQMTKNSYAMIHEISSVLWGQYTQMKSYMKHLDTVQKSIANLYKEYTNLEEEEINLMMGKESWFSADEYLEKGFVDELI